MSNNFYETDDETGVYIEDDPNFDDEDEKHMKSMKSSNIGSQDIVMVPHEDPIVDDETPNGNDKKSPTKMYNAFSTFPSAIRSTIKRWWICWMVTLIVGGSIFGTVYLFVFKNDAVTSSSSDSSNSNIGGSQSNDGIDVRISTVSPTVSPTVVPTNIPSWYPSASPSESVDVTDKDEVKVTSSPTMTPVTSTPTNTPTTLAPSSSPSTELYSQIIPIIQRVSYDPDAFNDVTSVQYMAADWIRSNSTIEIQNHEKIIRRYAIALLDISLHNAFVISLPSIDECEWLGVSCVSTNGDSSINNNNDVNRDKASNGAITSILWNDQTMRGRIPNDIGLLSNSLEILDLSDNEIIGTIPDALYDCTKLESIYLYKNQIVGTISSLIGKLSDLHQLFLNKNMIMGTIPSELGGFYNTNSQLTKPIEWLSVYDNALSGTIPSNLFWTNMKYLDLGKNKFSGSIPYDWIDIVNYNTTMMNLKSLYLDFNMFNGTLHDDFIHIGGGRIQQIIINDNSFTGEIPSDRDGFVNVTTFEVQNNLFTRINREICKQSVYENGMLAVFHSDCSICECTDLCLLNNITMC